MKNTFTFVASLLILHLATCSEDATLPLGEESKIVKKSAMYDPINCNVPCMKPEIPVCTNHGEDFMSECILDKHNCLNNQKRTVAHRGKCVKCLVDEEVFQESATILTLPERCVDLKCVGLEIYNGNTSQFVGSIKPVSHPNCQQELPVHLRKEIDELQDLCDGEANIEDPDLALTLTYTMGLNGEVAPGSNVP
ncbi:uncharacterized protein LOC143029108 [Oratosquilla oratoria]|uniref:uncharacterized protein LOC143029108 n=1 Tax=Oratosquilla oratoria TaxID=337810 RepID=UPI003F75AAC6